MLRILEKFPSDFSKKSLKRPEDDETQEFRPGSDERGSQDDLDRPGPQDDNRLKAQLAADDEEDPRAVRDNSDGEPITIRDLKKLIAMKSVGGSLHDEDEDGEDKAITDTGEEPNVIRREPRVQ